VDYEALDNEGVDLLFVLVVPKNETHAHLDVLAELATVFSCAEHRSALRQCDNADAIMNCLQRIDAAAPDAKRA
jgi:PTS system nitrogen regulatory IIA component